MKRLIPRMSEEMQSCGNDKVEFFGTEVDLNYIHTKDSIILMDWFSDKLSEEFENENEDLIDFFDSMTDIELEEFVKNLMYYFDIGLEYSEEYEIGDDNPNGYTNDEIVERLKYTIQDRNNKIPLSNIRRIYYNDTDLDHMLYKRVKWIMR